MWPSSRKASSAHRPRRGPEAESGSPFEYVCLWTGLLLAPGIANHTLRFTLLASVTLTHDHHRYDLLSSYYMPNVVYNLHNCLGSRSCHSCYV